MSKYDDPAYIGKKYNMLTVVGFDKKIYNSRKQAWLWRVKCDCGNVRMCDPRKVIAEKTKSCGCMKSTRMKDYNVQHKTVHGGRHERLYAIWHGMKERCYTVGCKDYKHYGGRGIRICHEWVNDYGAFRDWALNNGYADGLTIERIDYNLDYRPANCKWIPLADQATNKRNNLRLEYHGRTWVLSDLCKAKGLKYSTVYRRLHIMGWPIEKAIDTPIK